MCATICFLATHATAEAPPGWRCTPVGCFPPNYPSTYAPNRTSPTVASDYAKQSYCLAIRQDLTVIIQDLRTWQDYVEQKVATLEYVDKHIEDAIETQNANNEAFKQLESAIQRLIDEQVALRKRLETIEAKMTGAQPPITQSTVIQLVTQTIQQLMPDLTDQILRYLEASIYVEVQPE